MSVILTNKQISEFGVLCEQWIESDEKYPIDLNDCWKWLGLSRKDAAVRSLTRKCNEGVDFERSTKRWSSSGQTENIYKLSIDGFKHFAMQLGTERGRQVREYFIRIEKRARQLCEELARSNRKQCELEYNAHWHTKRDKARKSTKEASAGIQQAQNTKRRGDFMLKNGKFSKSVLGVYPSQLKKELGITRKNWSSRDFMSLPQLSTIDLEESLLIEETRNRQSDMSKEELNEICDEICDIVVSDKLKARLHGTHRIEPLTKKSTKKRKTKQELKSEEQPSQIIINVNIRGKQEQQTLDKFFSKFKARPILNE